MNRATSNFQLGILVYSTLISSLPVHSLIPIPHLASCPSASPIVIHSPYKQSALPGPPSTLLVLSIRIHPPFQAPVPADSLGACSAADPLSHGRRHLGPSGTTDDDEDHGTGRICLVRDPCLLHLLTPVRLSLHCPACMYVHSSRCLSRTPVQYWSLVQGYDIPKSRPAACLPNCYQPLGLLYIKTSSTLLEIIFTFNNLHCFADTTFT